MAARAISLRLSAESLLALASPPFAAPSRDSLLAASVNLKASPVMPNKLYLPEKEVKIYFDFVPEQVSRPFAGSEFDIFHEESL
jgi:hypothetical protein